MANELHKTLPLGIKLREALPFIGTLAVNGGKPAAAEACRKLLARLDETAEITAHVEIVHVLCQACDEFRSRNDPATVQLFEELINALKEAPRIVRGSFTFAPKDQNDIERAFLAMSSMIKK